MRNRNQSGKNGPVPHSKKAAIDKPLGSGFQSISSKKIVTETVRPESVGNNSMAGAISFLTGSTKERSRKTLFLLIGIIGSLLLCSIAIIKNQKPEQNSVAIAASKQSSIQDEREAEEKKEQEKQKEIRNNWKDYITVSNSNYAYGVLGGINNLSIQFSNKTDYVIDEVWAKVVYVKNNGKPWKTKLIPVYNLQPHSIKKQPLSKVNRGKSVEVTISKIVSKQMSLVYKER